MKKLIFSLSFGFLFITTQAQVLLGVKGGVNVSTITGSNYGSVQSAIGVNAGILASFPLFSHFTLQPELTYSGQGAKTTDLGVTATLSTTYFNIPLLLKYNHPSGIFIETGPQIGFLSKANLKFTNYTEDEKENYKSTDYAWTFGLGYLLKGVNLGIDARYNLGLSNFFEESYNGESKNNVAQVGLFFLFGFKAAAANPAP